MIWVFLAISAHMVWAVVVVGEKYLVSKRFDNPFLYLLLAFWVGPVVLLLLPFVDFYIPDLSMIGWIVLAGVCYFVGCSFYIKAMQIEEVTRINIWWNLIPIFNLILGWSLIGETLNFREIVAFIILFVAALIASVHSQRAKLSVSKGFILMLLACFFISVTDIITKYVSQFIPFSLIFIFLSLTLTVSSFSYFFSHRFRNDFKMERKKLKWGLVLLVIGITVLSKVGLAFKVWALSLGPVALVASMEGFQAVFVFIIVGVLTFFVPRIVQEEFDRKNLFLKLAALVLMLGGIAVLYLF